MAQFSILFRSSAGRLSRETLLFEGASTTYYFYSNIRSRLIQYRHSIFAALPSARSGGQRLLGFSLSTLVLAFVSLLAIPAMIVAGGELEWGAIALGQTIGGLGGVLVGYGWGWHGPVKIAQAPNCSAKRTEYIESVVTRCILFTPIALLCALVAYLLTPVAPLSAAAGAVQTASIGLTAAWYFNGLARPLLLFGLDTLPRVMGVLTGVVVMHLGGEAIFGPISMLSGMVAGFLVSSVWILHNTRGPRSPNRRRNLFAILRSNWHGNASAAGIASYNAAPLIVVSIVAPSAIPVFALVDKVRTQILIAAMPAVTVLQGWAPRAKSAQRIRRANLALIGSAFFSLFLVVSTFSLSPALISWLSQGKIVLAPAVLGVLALVVGLAFFESVLERVVLATFDSLRSASVAIVAGLLFALPFVAVGASAIGVLGALGGVLSGTVLVLAIELSAWRRLAVSQCGATVQ
jgi:O-antigen/teichoic acid export membrane protein